MLRFFFPTWKAGDLIIFMRDRREIQKVYQESKRVEKKGYIRMYRMKNT